MLGNESFSANYYIKKSSNCLVNPNNLLTHTHTHTHTQAHLASKHTFFALSYARAKRGVSPINKGLSRVPFVRFFVSPCQLTQKVNNRKFYLKTD